MPSILEEVHPLDYNLIQARMDVEQWITDTVFRSIYASTDTIIRLRAISALLPREASPSQREVTDWLGRLSDAPPVTLRSTEVQDRLLSLWAVMADEEAHPVGI